MPPSDLHRKLQAKFSIFLAARCTGRGVRSAREVLIDDGYVVDALALCSFQYAELIEFCRAWEMLKHSKEISGFIDSHEEVDYSLLKYNYFSIAAEVKVSRADFMSTFGKESGKHSNRFSPIADLHFVITPSGLIKSEEVPAFWGLIEQRGTGLGITKYPALIRQSNDNVAHLAHKILWAQDGVRDALWQEIVERHRQEDEEYRKQRAADKTTTPHA